MGFSKEVEKPPINMSVSRKRRVLFIRTNEQLVFFLHCSLPHLFPCRALSPCVKGCVQRREGEGLPLPRLFVSGQGCWRGESFSLRRNPSKHRIFFSFGPATNHNHNHTNIEIHTWLTYRRLRRRQGKSPVSTAKGDVGLQRCGSPRTVLRSADKPGEQDAALRVVGTSDPALVRVHSTARVHDAEPTDGESVRNGGHFCCTYTSLGPARLKLCGTSFLASATLFSGTEREQQRKGPHFGIAPKRTRHSVFCDHQLPFDLLTPYCDMGHTRPCPSPPRLGRRGEKGREGNEVAVGKTPKSNGR
jgi:hypothetical protein